MRITPNSIGSERITIKEAVDIARRNALYWSRFIRSAYLPYLGIFSEVVLQRLAPTLSEEGISKAADELEEKVSNGERWSEDLDPSYVADQAFQEGLRYYQTLSDVRWAVIAMSAAALYHLLEQQVRDLCRLAFFGPQGPTQEPGESINLLKQLGVDVTRFRSWPKIDELRHLANCVKHAEGNSCVQLRRLRPDFFEDWTVGSGPWFGKKLPVRNPLMGEDIYVSEEEFHIYEQSVGAFWEELVLLPVATTPGGCPAHPKTDVSTKVFQVIWLVLSTSLAALVKRVQRRS